jgi:hypothetical protein
VKLTETVWKKIREATENPSAFSKKAERKVLMAAVDTALEMITNEFFGAAARSHEQMIKRLNRLVVAGYGELKLAKAVLAVLADYKKLQAVSYDEDDDDFDKLADELLNPLVDLTHV